MALILSVCIVVAIVLLVAKMFPAVKGGIKSPIGVPPEIAQKVRHEGIASLVGSDQRSKYASPVFTPNGEKLIFSVPVTLSENHSTGRRGSGASVRIMTGVWYHAGGSQSTQEISPVDTGTLVLTDKRFIFNGERKNIEFPLVKLTQVSTSENGISLARSGREKVSYFMGLNSLRLALPITPEAGDTWNAGTIEFPLTGADVLEMLGLLQVAH